MFCRVGLAWKEGCALVFSPLGQGSVQIKGPDSGRFCHVTGFPANHDFIRFVVGSGGEPTQERREVLCEVVDFFDSFKDPFVECIGLGGGVGEVGQSFHVGDEVLKALQLVLDLGEVLVRPAQRNGLLGIVPNVGRGQQGVSLRNLFFRVVLLQGLLEIGKGACHDRSVVL